MVRVDRTAYWLILAFFGILFLAIWFYWALPPKITILAVLLAVPRLHDIGRSSWWAAGLFVTGLFAEDVFRPVSGEAFAGDWIVPTLSAVLMAGGVFVLGVIPGQPGANKFGLPPRLGR